MKNKRTFIGIPVKVNLKTIVEMIKTTIDAPSEDIKWVFGKNLHLTLSFLGELEQSKLDELVKKLEIIDFGSPFNIVLNHTGIFPNYKEPQVFWLGIDKGKDQIIEFVNQINDVLGKMDIPFNEKKFIPHVAIGRVKNKENIWKIDTNTYLNTVFSPTRFLVNSIHLYQSEMTQKGIKFTTIVSNNLE